MTFVIAMDLLMLASWLVICHCLSEERPPKRPPLPPEDKVEAFRAQSPHGKG